MTALRTELLQVIAEISELNPDLRLGQLIKPLAEFSTLIGFCVRRSPGCGQHPAGDSAALLMFGERAVELTLGQHKILPGREWDGGGSLAFAADWTSSLANPCVISDGVWKYVGWESDDRGSPAAKRIAAIVARIAAD